MSMNVKKENTKTYKILYLHELGETFLVVALPVLMYMIYGPIEIFCGNKREFLFELSDFSPRLVIFALVVWVGTSLLISLLREQVRVFLRFLILGIGICSYLQNMFWNIRLSEVNGTPMDWGKLGNFLIIDSLIWLVLLGIIIGVCYWRRKYRIWLGWISAFLCAVQLAAIIVLLVVTIPDNKSDGMELYISGEKQFDLAKKENIIVFILDTFGNTQLEQALAQYPDLLEDFLDFTFYNNADCHYYCTFPSMTHILTGNDFDFSSGSLEWLKSSWESKRTERFYSILHDEDYTVNLYSGKDPVYVYGGIVNLQGKFDNIHPLELSVNDDLICNKLIKMSAYRYVPYVIKPFLEVLTTDFSKAVVPKEEVPFESVNGEFYSQLQNRGLSVDKSMKKALIIQHLEGTHMPWLTNERAETVTEECTLEETVKGLLVIVNSYIEKMKELGLYDNSTIIITADHGSWGDDPQPIFFIKQKDEHHDVIQINSAPISADDFQATILSIVNIDYTDYGTSIFDWEEGDERERAVYMRYEDDDYPDVKGSGWNVYYKYTYKTNKQELLNKIHADMKEIIPAPPWNDSFFNNTAAR